MNDITQKCIKSAIEYGIAAYEVIIKPRRTNKLYDIKRKYFVSLKKQDNGIEELYLLLGHEHPYVKYTAAIYLLSIDEERAKHEIKLLVGYSKELDFSIKYLIIEWDKGKLREYYS